MINRRDHHHEYSHEHYANTSSVRLEIFFQQQLALEELIEFIIGRVCVGDWILFDELLRAYRSLERQSLSSGFNSNATNRRRLALYLKALQTEN